jgi:hypothetical protein
MMQSLLRSGAVQAKLTVSQPGDPFEREADSVAEAVMRMPEGAAPTISSVIDSGPQRKCAACAAGGAPCDECAHEEEEKVQRKEDGGAAASQAGPSPVPPSGGRPLPDSTRSFFEPRFGREFGGVRVHTGSAADASARSIQALAFTHGRDIVFRGDQYAPESAAGRRLLAHELTHVVQQGRAGAAVQRKCDPAVVGVRTVPVFFPQEPKILDVFRGGSTLETKSTKKAAIGLVQQALADLCFSLGKGGRNKDGVDRDFGTGTVDAVKAFQKTESIAESGVVDKETLRCLDERRAHTIVPCTAGTSLIDSDLEVSFERDSVALTGGKTDAADVFFERGGKSLDKTDKEAIKKIFNAHKKEALTLVGTRSEDEELDFPSSLPDDRIKAVDKELKKLGHKKTRTRKALAESQGAIDFWQFRKVRIIPASSVRTQPDCSTDPAGWTKGRGPCDATDDKTVKDNIDLGVKLMDKAIAELTKKDATAKQAVKDRFGGFLSVSQTITKLTKWRKFLNEHVRAHSFCANACHKACAGTGAYLDPPTKETTICGSILLGANVGNDEALLLVHEAGHGALDTQDVAYETTRLIGSIQKDSLSRINTDSWILLIKCLNGLGCGPKASKDTFPGFDTAKKQDVEAADALAWLERWMDWVWQDVNNLYESLSSSLQSGAWTEGSKGTRDLLFKHFGLHRPEGSSLAATRGEQFAVAAIHDRMRRMMISTTLDREVTLDKTPGATGSWQDQPTPKPSASVPAGFVKLGRRKQVEALLALLVHAQMDIFPDAEPLYVKFVIADAKTWFDRP